MALRCLHVESVLGLEFDAVILLLTQHVNPGMSIDDFVEADSFGDEWELTDDDGFDIGVRLNLMKGAGAQGARAYVGSTRARTLLIVIGSDQAFTALLRPSGLVSGR
jgi:ATP-dependent exoDNAse (exonuclease V) beta subunit